jgi:hypothetical protein
MRGATAVTAVLLCFGPNYVYAKELNNWQNVHGVVRSAVVVETRFLSKSASADARLQRYGHTLKFDGEILEVGNEGMMLKITHVAGKPISSDAHMLAFLLGSRTRLVTGKAKEVLYAVTPILKSDVVRVAKKNGKFKRWCSLGIAPKEKEVYCPLPKNSTSQKDSGSLEAEEVQDIYTTIQ